MVVAVSRVAALVLARGQGHGGLLWREDDDGGPCEERGREESGDATGRLQEAATVVQRAGQRNASRSRRGQRLRSTEADGVVEAQPWRAAAREHMAGHNGDSIGGFQSISIGSRWENEGHGKEWS